MQSYNDVKLLLKQQILGLISKIKFSSMEEPWAGEVGEHGWDLTFVHWTF